MAQYPNYITKTLLGNQSTGLPIYRYDFINAKPLGLYTKFPKMFFTSGVHPEKGAVWALYNFMKEICDRWDQNELLEVLRWNVDFIIVPVVNPYAMNGSSNRTNPNGVDINRNFPTSWTYGGEGTDNFSGNTALSELESQYVNQIFTNETGILFYSDFHNYAEDDGYNFCVISNQQHLYNIGKALIRKMSRKWKNEQAFFPQDETTMLGWTSKLSDTTRGTTTAHAASFGYQSAEFEYCATIYREPIPKAFSANAIHYGIEAFTNFILMVLRNLTSRY